MKTIDDVMGRCRIDEETGCWHWGGEIKTDARGVRMPTLWVFDSLQQRMRAMSGPTAVLELTGRRLTAQTIGWRACLCDDCLNPSHVMGGTRREFGSFVRAMGLFKNRPARVAANRKSARARSVVTPEIVADIRSSHLTGRELAAKHGLKVRHVSHIRTGTTWKDRVLPGASVFTLGAR